MESYLRPHNSGHWTLDACFIDQFEQHIRAICGLPLGSGKRFANATMQNILGTEREKVGLYFPNHNARVHLYGKEVNGARDERWDTLRSSIGFSVIPGGLSP